MSISDLYSVSFRTRNRDHFAAIVRVAMSDGKISPGEHSFLERLSKNLDISGTELEDIMKNPTRYPVNPPVTYEERLERLYDIVRMVRIDHITGEEEFQMMIRLGIGLGFSPGNTEFIVKKAMNLLDLGVSIEIFKEEIKHMNR